MSDTPPTPPPVQGGPPPSQPSFTETLIPSSNPDALSSYYVGLFSILPIFGLAMGPFAISRGRRALKLVKENPQLPGKTHAGVGIGCGALGLLFNILIVAFIVAIALSVGGRS